jgi:hypothetical protein
MSIGNLTIESMVFGKKQQRREYSLLWRIAVFIEGSPTI